MTKQNSTDPDARLAFEPLVSLSPHQRVLKNLDARFAPGGRLASAMAKRFPALEPPRPYIPDAWAIDEDQETVFVVEVTDTNGLRSKVAKIVEFGLWLDSMSWDLVLIEVDVNLGCRFLEWEWLWQAAYLRQGGRANEVPFSIEGLPLFGG